MTRFNDPTRLIEDRVRLEEAIKLVKAVDYESVNDNKSGDHEGDKLATEGLYWGMIKAMQRFCAVARTKESKIYA
jgi:hypothetical protein